MTQDKLSDSTAKHNLSGLRVAQWQMRDFSFGHHGLAHMNEAQSPVAWFFWFFFTLIMLVPMVWFIYNSMSAFLAFDVNTRFERVEMKRPALPVITFCPKTPFKAEPFEHLLKKYEADHNATMWKKFPAEAMEFIEGAAAMLLRGKPRNPYLDPAMFLAHLFHFHPAIHANLSWTCEETIVKLFYMRADAPVRRESQVCELWETFPNAYYGNCFRFNMNQEAVSYVPGAIHGIKIGAYMSEDDFVDVFDYLSTWSGFRILLTGNESDLRTMEDGRDLALGQTIQIALKKETLFKTTKNAWSDCMSDYPEDLQDFRVKLRKSYYSKGSCLALCYLREVMSMASCFPYPVVDQVSLGEIFENVRPCRVMEAIDVTYNAKEKCDAICKPECTREIWRQEVITEPIPPVLEKKKYEFMKDEFGFDKLSFSVINIFYADMHETRVVESPAKLPEDLIGEIGGQLGLWCGMSIMTVFELIVICSFCGRRRISDSRVEEFKGMP